MASDNTPVVTRKIGAHVSASGGVSKAVERASSIGANCVQVFAGSPRSWRRPDLSTIDTNILFSKMNEYAVSPIITHSLYLVNFASEKKDLLEKSFTAVKNDLEFDALVQGGGVVVHLGSHQGRGWDACKEQVVAQIIALLKATPSDSRLLVENSAGQNGKLCSDLVDIRWVLDTVEQQTATSAHQGFVSQGRLGWCFDTCHGWAYGYMLGTKEWGMKHPQVWEVVEKKHPPAPATLYASAEKNEPIFVLNEMERLSLFETLKVIHVNDSKDPFGSGRDRHQNLGEGSIPQEMLKFFVNYAKILTLPLILEVPGIDGTGPDEENISRLQQLVQ